MKNNIFNKIIQNRTLMLNIILDNDYLSNCANLYIIKNKKEVKDLIANKHFIDILQTHQKIVITTNREEQVIVLLKQIQLSEKYISLDLDGLNLNKLTIILQNQALGMVKQIRLCYLIDDLIHLDLDGVIDKFIEFNGHKILLIYLNRFDNINKTFWNKLFLKLKKYKIILNILPLPRKILGELTQKYDRDSYILMFNMLKFFENKYRLQVFYDFPCGSVLNKRFEGFCPGYFSLTVFSDGNISFCKFAKINFGNMYFDELKKINQNRINYLNNIPLACCKKCKYYLVCGGGCLLDLDTENQKNLICFL
jgi:radical SAM protein with 4Fe4S-binding SPASM domain